MQVRLRQVVQVADHGSAYDAGSNTYYFAGGGAGITGGTSSYCRLGTSNTQTKAEDGAGGLLILYTDTLENNGTISSKGSKGAGASCYLPGNYRGATGGGGSGGGSVNVFYNYMVSPGEITAVGGAGGDVSKCTNNNMGLFNGGKGGDGSITVTRVLPDLVYLEKEIEIGVNESYKIDIAKLKYYSQNLLSNDVTTVGNLAYEIEDTTVASVDSNGNVLGISKGKTKIKITDTTNNIEAYVYLVVKECDIIPDIEEGNNFTINLKSNGTVWSYGLNDNGQLGIGTNDNVNKPTQISSLSDIKAISTGTAHSLVLTSMRRDL